MIQGGYKASYGGCEVCNESASFFFIFRRSPSFHPEDHSEYSLIHYHGYVRRSPSLSLRVSPVNVRSRRDRSPGPPPPPRPPSPPVVRDRDQRGQPQGRAQVPAGEPLDPRQEDINNLWASSQPFRPTLSDPALELLRSAFNLSSVPEYVQKAYLCYMLCACS